MAGIPLDTSPVVARRRIGDGPAWKSPRNCLTDSLSLFSRHLQDVFINRDCVRHDSSLLELKGRWYTDVYRQATDECDLLDPEQMLGTVSHGNR